MRDLGATLLVGAFIHPEEARMAELAGCLEQNGQNRHISDIRVFVEDDIRSFSSAVNAKASTSHRILSSALANEKVRTVERGVRTKFSDFFAYANRECRGKVVIVSNADIEFNDTLALLADRDLSRTFLCLSMDSGKGCYPPHVSQDVWIFKAPLPAFPSGWTMGLLGCDNKLAYEAARAGMGVVNPCFSISTVHRHRSGVRNHTQAERLEGPYLNVYPCGIEAVPAVTPSR